MVIWQNENASGKHMEGKRGEKQAKKRETGVTRGTQAEHAIRNTKPKPRNREKGRGGEGGVRQQHVRSHSDVTASALGTTVSTLVETASHTSWREGGRVGGTSGLLWRRVGLSRGRDGYTRRGRSASRRGPRAVLIASHLLSVVRRVLPELLR